MCIHMCESVTQSCLILCDPMDYSQSGYSVHGKNIRVGSHSILQGIFMTQGLNPGLLHCRHILYHLSHQENPRVYMYHLPFGLPSHHSAPRRVSCAIQ